MRAPKPLAKLFDLVVVASLAELFLDRLHLLPQDVLALRLAHLLLHHRGDLFLHAQHFELAPHHGQHQANASFDLERFEDLLLVGHARVLLRKVGGDEIRERAGLTHVVEDACRLLGQIRHQPEHLARRFAEARAERVELHVSRERLTDARDARPHVRLETDGGGDAKTTEPIEHDAVVALAEPDDLHHSSERADVVEVFERGLVELRALLAHDAYERAVSTE